MRVRPALIKEAMNHPVEAFHRLAGQLELREVETQREAARDAYQPEPAWLEHLHAEIGVQSCGEAGRFGRVWADIETHAHGLDLSSHDGDAALGRVVWCAIRHGGAMRVVETGVARGVSTRVILEALARRADAALWSVDLPLVSATWAPVFATAVPERIRNHWHYVRGPSRRVLPKLLANICPIDVFVQDTRSTLATASFEFEAAWAALRPGGILVANSVDRSLAFAGLVERKRPEFAFVAPFRQKAGLFGLARKDSR